MEQEKRGKKHKLLVSEMRGNITIESTDMKRKIRKCF